MAKWVPILVRLEDLTEFQAMVAEREARRTVEPSEAADYSPAAPSASPGRTGDAELAGHPLWSVDDLLTLSKGTSETAKRWTLANDACCEIADSDNPWLWSSEVAQRTGMPISQWRDATRKITRHLKANYPHVPRNNDGDPVWPLLGELRPGFQEARWAMNREQAKQWRQIRGLS